MMSKRVSPELLLLLVCCCVWNCSYAAPNSKSDLRIYGGELVKITKVPYMALYRSKDNSKLWPCGAVIVAHQFLLSAAHCTSMKKDNMKITVGTANVNEGENYEVEQVFAHPKFDFKDADYDLCVIKLKKKLIFSNKVKSIEMADKTFVAKPGNIMKLMGFGSTEVSNAYSKQLREVNVTYIDFDTCRKEYEHSNLHLTERMICAGGEIGKGMYTGDGGGPLVYNDFLIGIVSWGPHPPGQKDHPDVYASVTSMRDFIDGVIENKLETTDPTTAKPTTTTPTTPTTPTTTPTTPTTPTTTPTTPTTKLTTTIDPDESILKKMLEKIEYEVQTEVQKKQEEILKKIPQNVMKVIKEKVEGIPDNKDKNKYGKSILEGILNAVELIVYGTSTTKYLKEISATNSERNVLKKILDNIGIPKEITDEIQNVIKEIQNKIQKEILYNIKEKVKKEIQEEVQKLINEIQNEIQEKILNKIKEKILREIQEEVQNVIKEIQNEMQEKILEKIKDDILKKIKKEDEKIVEEEILNKIRTEILNKIRKKVEEEIDKDIN